MAETRPDFLVHCDSCSFYLEAKALDDDSFPESVQLKEIKMTLEKELPSSPQHYDMNDPRKVGNIISKQGIQEGITYDINSQAANRQNPNGNLLR